MVSRSLSMFHTMAHAWWRRDRSRVEPFTDVHCRSRPCRYAGTLGFRKSADHRHRRAVRTNDQLVASPQSSGWGERQFHRELMVRAARLEVDVRYYRAAVIIFHVRYVCRTGEPTVVGKEQADRTCPGSFEKGSVARNTLTPKSKTSTRRWLGLDNSACDFQISLIRACVKF